jgi:hypothetical protein
LTQPKPKSFWEQAALRAQGSDIPAIPDEPETRKSLWRDSPPASEPPPPLAPTEDELHLRLAEELEYARRILDAMGDDLSGDPGVVVRHMTSLQAIDIIGQMLGHLATVIRCNDPEAAVERIGMCELKSRLQRRGGV